MQVLTKWESEQVQVYTWTGTRSETFYINDIRARSSGWSIGYNKISVGNQVGPDRKELPPLTPPHPLAVFLLNIIYYLGIGLINMVRALQMSYCFEWGASLVHSVPHTALTLVAAVTLTWVSDHVIMLIWRFRFEKVLHQTHQSASCHSIHEISF